MKNISKTAYLFQHKDTVEQFANAMRAAGLEPPSLISADGRIHRFTHPEDNRHSKNGWYVLYPDFPAAGAFGCWKRQIRQTFSTPTHQNQTTEMIQRTARLDCLQRQIGREEEKQAAIALWGNSSPATNGCKYLQAKGVKSHGLRYHQNALLVPVMDCECNVHGVQRIWPDGSKRFVAGTEKQGHFFLLGDLKKDSAILIAEGYATAATLYEIAGQPAIVAFDSGNLLSVTKVFRSAFPQKQIVLCGDDDHDVSGNPGRTKAAEAAEIFGCQLALPCFPDNRATSDTDFNDLYLLDGAESVVRCLQNAGVTI